MQGRGGEGVEGGERIVREIPVQRPIPPPTVSGQEVFQGEFQGYIDRGRGYMQQQHSADSHLEISHQ